MTAQISKKMSNIEFKENNDFETNSGNYGIGETNENLSPLWLQTERETA
jgi:hypothetical protein